MHPNRMARFMRASSQLNKQPTVKTDNYEPKSYLSPKNAQPQSRINNKPMRIPKKLSHQSQESQFKGTLKKSPPPKKRPVGSRYK